MSSVTIYLLFVVTPDEEQQIKDYLSQSNDSIDITVVYWTGTDDGSTGDVYALFAQYPAEDVMIIIDREALNSGNFIVANGKAATSPAFVKKTLEQYGYTYSDTWYQDTTLVEIVSKAGVPMGRVDASQGVAYIYESIVTETIEWEEVVYEVDISVDVEFDTTELDAQVESAKEQYGDEENAEQDDEEGTEDVEVEETEETEEVEEEGEDGEEVDVEETEESADVEVEETEETADGEEETVDVEVEETEETEEVEEEDGGVEEHEPEAEEEPADDGVTSQQGDAGEEE